MPSDAGSKANKKKNSQDYKLIYSLLLHKLITTILSVLNLSKINPLLNSKIFISYKQREEHLLKCHGRILIIAETFIIEYSLL
jgi:hypothetical protein